MLTRLRGALGKRFQLDLDSVNDYGDLGQDSQRSLTNTARSESSEVWLSPTPRDATEGDISDEEESPRFMCDVRMAEADKLFEVCDKEEGSVSVINREHFAVLVRRQAQDPDLTYAEVMTTMGDPSSPMNRKVFYCWLAQVFGSCTGPQFREVISKFVATQRENKLNLTSSEDRAQLLSSLFHSCSPVDGTIQVSELTKCIQLSEEYADMSAEDIAEDIQETLGLSSVDAGMTMDHMSHWVQELLAESSAEEFQETLTCWLTLE